MLLLDAYSYLFYRMYRFSSRWKHDVTPPHLTAFLGIVAIVWSNIFLLLVIVDTVLAPGYSVISHLSKLHIYLSFAVLAVPLYFAFLHRGRYQHISARYQSETARQRRVRGVVIVTTLVLMWGLIVLFSVLHAARVHSPHLTNRSSQPLAVAMRMFEFMKQFSEFAMLASASGG
jgi:heme/copper-type cytochrome/quinol oxidase subunit 2